MRENFFFLLLFIFSNISNFPINAQDLDPELDDIEKQAQYYNEHQMPDSVLWLIEEELPPYRNENTNQYHDILLTGIRAAIISQDKELAEKYVDQLLVIIGTSDKKARADLFQDLANWYSNMHEYTLSTKYCNLAYPLYNELHNHKGTTMILLTMFDNSYLSQRDTANTEYLNEAIEIAEETKDSSLLSDVYFAAGRSYTRSAHYENAVKFFELARQFTPEDQVSSYLEICIFQQLCYTLCDSVDRVCEISQHILDISIANGLEWSLSNAYIDRAYCSAKRGMADSTRFYLDLSEEERAKTPKANASPGYYNQMYKISMIISDYDRALHYLETMADQQNQINRRNRASELGDARAEFDYLLQKARISELKAQNMASEEKARRRKVTILGIAAVLLISLGAFLNIRRQYLKLGNTYRSLVKKHVEVDRLNRKLMEGKKDGDVKRTGVNIKDEDKILENLNELLEEDKIYKRPELSLHVLADELGTNTSYLSTIINTHFRVNLKSLINKYRIDEARKLLVSEETSGYSIEGIAHEVGFQSRSVFYQTFKQITGMTPTAYVKTYKSVCPDS
jgi:AraC-like DNA-binding protein